MERELWDIQGRLRLMEIAQEAHEREDAGHHRAAEEAHERVEKLVKDTQAAYADGITAMKGQITALSADIWKKFSSVEDKAWNALLAAFGALFALCAFLLGKILHLL